MRALALALASVLCLPAVTALAADGGASPAPREGGAAASRKRMAVPFTLPKPEGWGSETLPLPPGFVPELPYRGLEELRFAPGMFKAGAADFFSYAFVWWLEGEPALTKADLERDLARYFQGLAAVTERKAHDPAKAKTTVALQERGGPETRQLEGTIRTYDAFSTHAPVTLNVRLSIFRCPRQARTVAFFELSPQPMSHDIFRTLDGIRSGFACTLDGGR